MITTLIVVVLAFAVMAFIATGATYFIAVDHPNPLAALPMAVVAVGFAYLASHTALVSLGF